MKTSSHFALVLNIWLAAAFVVLAHWNKEASLFACFAGVGYAGILMLKYAGKSD